MAIALSQVNKNVTEPEREAVHGLTPSDPLSILLRIYLVGKKEAIKIQMKRTLYGLSNQQGAENLSGD